MRKLLDSKLYKWWLAFRQPPIVVFGSGSGKALSGSRTKYVLFKITKKRAIQLSLRKFRTSKLNRSKKFNQIVVPLYFGRTKELSIRQIVSRSSQTRISAFINNINKPIPFSYALMLIGISGVIMYGSQMFFSPKLQPVTAFAQEKSSEIAQKPEAPKDMSRSAPTKIVVPSIGVESGIMEIGRLADGSLETPPLFEHVTGWYRDSPSPGQFGPAIIVGHVDTYKGPAVFWKLGRLVLNDQILVTRTDGEVVTYSVTGLEQFDQNSFPTEKVYGNTVDAELRLITCGGTFNHKTLHYDKNTVVFAKIVPKVVNSDANPVVKKLLKTFEKQNLTIL